MGKPKIALYWCSSCGGCEESVVDIAENVLTVRELADIVFWPVALDVKYKDVEAFADNEIVVTLINGSIRMDEQEHMAKLLRRKSQKIIAQGACAHIGGIYGLANLNKKGECLDKAYKEAPSVKNPKGVLPQVKTKDCGRELELPDFHDTVRSLNQVIDVDYYIPGCPPNPKYIVEAILAVLGNKELPYGYVFAQRRSLCHSCHLVDSKPQDAVINKIKRVHEWIWDPEKCFLAQDMICLGPATRGGCEERCIKGNMPCRGCYGPVENVEDQGGKFLSALAGIINSNDEQQLKKIAGSFVDIAGFCYRYSLPTSLLKKKVT